MATVNWGLSLHIGKSPPRPGSHPKTLMSWEGVPNCAPHNPTSLFTPSLSFWLCASIYPVRLLLLLIRPIYQVATILACQLPWHVASPVTGRDPACSQRASVRKPTLTSRGRSRTDHDLLQSLPFITLKWITEARITTSPPPLWWSTPRLGQHDVMTTQLPRKLTPNMTQNRLAGQKLKQRS